APDPGAGRVAERAVAFQAAGHLRKHRVEKHRLEILRGGFRLGLRLRRAAGDRLLECDVAARVRVGVRGGGEAIHHITSISASMAPAALIACRMPIRSRGPMPRPLRPSTSCCNETPFFTKASFLPSSCTPIAVFGVTRVRPRDKGL